MKTKKEKIKQGREKRRLVGIQWNLRIKDTLGQGVLSFIERLPLLKCTGIIGIGTSRLYREVFFIRSVLCDIEVMNKSLKVKVNN